MTYMQFVNLVVWGRSESNRDLDLKRVLPDLRATPPKDKLYLRNIETREKERYRISVFVT